ncbi:hypothetical protein EK904_003730 [Melospiza melodia maxima]|nr:hypothetical protein EK904_003730 [Melospiza melodia maxima]
MEEMSVWLAHLACRNDASTLKWDVQKPLDWDMVELLELLLEIQVTESVLEVDPKGKVTVTLWFTSWLWYG